MMAEGFLAEVRNLLALGCSPQAQALQGLGYKQLVAYLQGELSLAAAIELIKRDTRHFAKRQLTWFRRDQRIRWFDPEDGIKNIECALEIALYLGRTLEIAVE
jgi:tRNA dimethylallyltransferase